MNFKLLLIALISICRYSPVESANILGVFAFPGRSHWVMINTLMKELVQRGHHLTVISNYPNAEKIENYEEIIISPIYDFWGKAVGADNLFELTEMSFKQMLDMLCSIGFSTTHYALENRNVQDFVINDTQKFDLIIAEQFYQEAFLMLSHKYQAPVVTIGTFGFAHYMSPMFGVFTPWSHVPHEFLPYTDHMTFLERTHNFAAASFEYIYRQYYYLPEQERMAQKYFQHLKGPLPSVYELEKKVSLVLLNSHAPLTSPRATVAGMVQVGGLHIKDLKPLKEDLQTFLDGAKDGAIYFSLGTNLKSSEMPPEKIKTFMNVFRSLKQRVLWKFENENIEDLPANVMVKKWMPQSDILGHPNVKVFITHGGLLGTQEGIHRGVPMLGIPIYCDQHLNMVKANLGGYAVTLYFPNITESSLKWALDELLYNPSYANKIKETSQIFRDRPISALEESIYWIEYVIRYKGAPQIRSSGLDLSWISLMSIDVIAFLLSGVILVTFVLAKILKMLLFKKIKNSKLD